MTIREAAIVEAYTGYVMLIGDKRKYIYEYLKEIMGEPIFTHEIPKLADKIQEKARPDFLRLCRNLTENFNDKGDS